MSSYLFFSIVSMNLIVVTLFLAILIIIIIISRNHVIEIVGGGGHKKYHPIGGTIMNVIMNFKRAHHFMTALAQKYKTYRIITPFMNQIYTADPANVEYILKTNFNNYGKGGYNHMMLEDFLGDGIFTVDGEKWRELRKLSSYEFSSKVSKEFSNITFKKNAAKLTLMVSEAAKLNTVMDFHDLFMKSAIDSLVKVAFGVELDTLCGTVEEGTKFSKALDDASVLIHWRYINILWKIKKIFNIGSEAKLKKNIKVIDDFVYKLIHTKTEQMKKSEDEDNSSLKRGDNDILSRFLQFTKMDPKYTRDIILNVIIAGKNTTAGTLSWFFYMLGKHPLIQEKVAQEIYNVSKTTEDNCTSIEDFAANLNVKALDKMQYLHAAITETLRLYPPVPVDPKICFVDDTLPDGFSVHKGDMVAYHPYAMGRMKFIWGDNAEDFIPERWLDENGCFQQQSPFKFTAFQAGPRICLGKEFAYRQMKIFSAVLLRYFIFKLGDDKKEVTYRTMINLLIDGGLHVRAFER